jgi:hypothetical protein
VPHAARTADHASVPSCHPRGVQLVPCAPVLVELPGDYKSTALVAGELFDALPAGPLAGVLVVSSVYCRVLVVGPREGAHMHTIHSHRPTGIYCSAAASLTFIAGKAGGELVLPCAMTETEALRCSSLRAVNA